MAKKETEVKEDLVIVNGGLTEAQVEKIKRDHPGCSVVSVLSEDGKTKHVVKDPYTDKSIIQQLFDEGNTFELGERVLELGWIAGDEKIKQDLHLRVAASYKLYASVSLLKADVKKL